jgi:hypothetical protein
MSAELDKLKAIVDEKTDILDSKTKVTITDYREFGDARRAYEKQEKKEQEEKKSKQ